MIIFECFELFAIVAAFMMFAGLLAGLYCVALALMEPAEAKERE